MTKPAESRKAYCIVEGLSYCPGDAHPMGPDRRVFGIGDEVQDALPPDVLAACVRNGEVSYEKPGE